MSQPISAAFVRTHAISFNVLVKMEGNHNPVLVGVPVEGVKYSDALAVYQRAQREKLGQGVYLVAVLKGGAL